MDNVLVIGSGFLGGNIVNEFRNNEIKVIGTNYNKNSSDEIHFDITNPVITIAPPEKNIYLGEISRNHIRFNC